MKSLLTIFATLLLGLLCFGVTIASEQTEQSLKPGSYQQDVIVEEIIQPTSEGRDTPPYVGHIRVYIVEPTSRWYDSDFYPYGNGFLEFAIDEPITIPFNGSFDKTVIWKGAAGGYGDVTEGNLKAIAVVTNDVPHTGYSDPPSGSPYTAYYVDAAAGATPGNTGYDSEDGGFSHTAFVDEGTATW